MSDIQLLLLAAGGSKRMKEPKQLLSWSGTTLIEHQIHNLMATGKILSVVVGAYSNRVIPLIDSLPVNIIKNDNWQYGMGSSISKGIQDIHRKHPKLDAVLISLIDQPLLTTQHFNKMFEVFKPGNDQIIVSNSKDSWAGAPVLFDKTYIQELIQLQGDEGAKKITNQYKSSVLAVDAGDVLIDMDTPEAYQQLKQGFNDGN